jgi:hypothetical protein
MGQVRDRGDGCSWKEVVASWDDGERIVERIVGENIDAGHPASSLGLHVYRCSTCSRLHIGHSGVHAAPHPPMIAAHRVERAAIAESPAPETGASQ